MTLIHTLSNLKSLNFRIIWRSSWRSRIPGLRKTLPKVPDQQTDGLMLIMLTKFHYVQIFIQEKAINHNSGQFFSDWIREQPIWNQSCLAVRAGKMGLVSSPLGISRVIPARKSFLNHCIDQYWPSLIGQDGGYWASLFYGLSPPLNPPSSHRKKWPIYPAMFNEQALSKTHITLWEAEFVPV